MTMSNLYEVSVPVVSESLAVRHTAFAKALAEVFVRVSGNSAVTQVDAIKQAIKNAPTYVDQYAYAKSKQNNQDSLKLNIRFASSTVKKVLVQSGQSIWGANRPLMLVWLVDKNQQGAQFLGGNGHNNPVLKVFLAQAESRGLPVLLPMMDLTDLQNLSASAVESNNVLAIEDASHRYPSDAILTVSLDETNPSSITAHWALLFQGKQASWDSSGATVQKAVKQGVNDVADSLAQTFSVSAQPADAQAIQLQVKNLSTLSSYHQVERYLNSLASVKQVRVSSIIGSSMIFTLALKTSVPALVEQIKLDHRLLPISLYNQDGLTQAHSLIYQYKE